MMQSRRILVARPVPEAVRDAARSRFHATLADRNMSGEEVVAVSLEKGIEGIVMGGNLRLDAATINFLPPSVQVVATTSVGTDHIDLVAAAKKRMVVTNVPDVGIDCTADLAFMHILMASRRAIVLDRFMRAGWGRRLGFDEMLGTAVHHRRIGIVGLGRIGQLVARRALGFDMEVHYYDLHRLLPGHLPQVNYHESIDSLCGVSDILTLHLPDLPSTRGILSAERIWALPEGAVVVNAGRGNLLDYEALIQALESGHLSAAGLDTFPDEPKIDPRLIAMPQVTLTPHAGSATVQSRVAICMRCLDNIAAVLNGDGAINPVVAA